MTIKINWLGCFKIDIKESSKPGNTPKVYYRAERASYQEYFALEFLR
ncbi:MAG: hypothetical protein WC627_11100 [Legionella sp.]|jgi:hypothetical protein